MMSAPAVLPVAALLAGSLMPTPSAAAPRARPLLTNATARCQPHEPCWPTPEEVAELREALGPSLERELRWEGCRPPALDCSNPLLRFLHPINSAVPIFSPWDQPLYSLGFGEDQPRMEGLYARPQSGWPGCYASAESEMRPECFAATRNWPLHGWDPAFTVFATTAEHVQLAVRFAATHNLCVAVAGTGHDFMNRHSCDNGVFIRTTLLKEQVWNLDDPRWPDGSVRLGAGTTFRECSNGRAASS